MHRLALVLCIALLTSCAFGPTPERTGFNYPQAGIKFSPRRHVTSDTVRAEVAIVEDAPYRLLFPRTKSYIETPHRRLLTTGIEGEWDENSRPLYDEISLVLFGAEPEYSFELTEERDIEVPWPGLASRTAKLRVFHMSPLEGIGGTPQYTFTVLVHHYGNTIELCWRQARDLPPDEEMLETFFYWTKGMRFYEPRTR